ncbi:hypothetical protein SLS64_000859 [Diaporthe eres]
MAHIASCMSDADVDRLSIGSYIARSVSPLPVVDESETRKYQLFPREKQAAGPQGKGLDPEQAFALAMAQNGDKGDKPCTGGLRLRIKEHNLIRRRKVSVPELGPMTTVHEAAMDSQSGSVTASIMDRGRPRKRNDGLKRSASKTSKSAERRAFETLPKGWKVTDAAQMLEQAERVALHKQAMQQAARFEVMRKEDVDSLSRELRNLDERTEYLRRTYHSLRAGRRNLHSRICQYLRSPRMAKFSHDSMLKQEEALAELDSSIDDWVNKLEQAENRRTRIRQKLLEHVAAAVTLPVSGAVGVSESLQLALGVGAAPPTAPANLSTPPRSPVKSSFTPRIESSSPSPQRVVAQVPSTIIEQPVVENAATVGLGINQTGEKQTQAKEKETVQHPLSGMRRADVESIRIYAGDEVAALLADVESQMDRMSKAADDAAALRMKDTCVPDLPELNANMSEEERKQVHRQHSHEKLQGTPTTSSSTSSAETITGTSTTKPSSPNSTPRTATPTATETKEPAAGEFLLTNAVFKP